MVKKIITYVCDDGREFKTSEEANKHTINLAGERLERLVQQTNEKLVKRIPYQDIQRLLLRLIEDPNDLKTRLNWVITALNTYNEEDDAE